jgi:hypothetical protein
MLMLPAPLLALLAASCTSLVEGLRLPLAARARSASAGVRMRNDRDLYYYVDLCVRHRHVSPMRAC